MTEYPTEKQFRPRRNPKRAAYDRATVHAILDAGYIAHVGFAGPAGPQVIPMFYARAGESLLIHGSTKSGTALASGAPMTLCVTHLDGLVLARSWFHHSVLYRSVIVHGTAELLDGAAKLAALRAIVERIAEGRADLTRAPNAKELKATAVLRVPIEQVAAKVRGGGVADDPEDMDLPVWAGVIPVETCLLPPVADEALDPTLPTPEFA